MSHTHITQSSSAILWRYANKELLRRADKRRVGGRGLSDSSLGQSGGKMGPVERVRQLKPKRGRSPQRVQLLESASWQIAETPSPA